jgi:hypothetical protein
VLQSCNDSEASAGYCTILLYRGQFCDRWDLIGLTPDKIWQVEELIMDWQSLWIQSAEVAGYRRKTEAMTIHK